MQTPRPQVQGSSKQPPSSHALDLRCKWAQRALSGGRPGGDEEAGFPGPEAGPTSWGRGLVGGRGRGGERGAGMAVVPVDFLPLGPGSDQLVELERGRFGVLWSRFCLSVSVK